MATYILSLRESCLKRIAQLLKDDHWDPDLPEDENPFRQLPAVLIEELITYVAEISDSSDHLLSSQLQLLIRTGRVQHFKLEDEIGLESDEENIKRILEEVSSASRILLAVKIRLRKYNESDVTGALTSLIRKYAHDLKHVESDIPFDITALHGAAQLEKLTLYFNIHGYRISEVLRISGQEIKPHNFLKEVILESYPTHVSYEEVVLESYPKHVSYEDIATVLKCCPELISIDCDISKSLKILHAEELHSDSLTHKYKLKKCKLGNFGRSFDADILSVRIATLTCPYLQDVTVYVKDFEPITVLSECRNLDTLSVHWQGSPTKNHYNGMRSLLEKPNFGQRLKSLILEHFDNVDFDSIGKNCPNIERLMVRENNLVTNMSREVLATSFRKLKCLQLLDSDYSRHYKRQPMDDHLDYLPIGLLSTAVDLEMVCFISELITDVHIIRMLEANRLSKVKTLYLSECNLSLSGLRKLVCSLTSLEYFIAWSPSLKFKQAASVFRELNPRVIFSVNFICSGDLNIVCPFLE